jgi:benzoate/toluate 1,2-dioxygenase subunit alpha
MLLTQTPAARAAQSISDEELSSLVEKDRIHRRVYTDPAVFELEMERIFERTWIYVGHESQVKEPGQYFATTIGRQPVLMIRHKDGSLNVLYNRCPHKGAMLVGETCGKAKALRCLYHGWIFDTDGKLQVIPQEQGYDGSGFGKGNPEADMRKVARTGVYRGFVFASLSPDVPDFMDWLGGVATSIDNMVDRAPEGELEVTGGVLRYIHNCNWKMPVENLNDMMHAKVTHQSSTDAARVTSRQLLGDEDEAPAAIEILAPFGGNYSFFEEMGLHAYDWGHSFSGGRVSIHSNYSAISDYDAAMIAAYGEERVREIFSINRHNTVFYPSATIKGPIQTLRVFKPISVDQTLIESYTFRMKGAPEALLERSILYCTLINSSANLVGPDDLEAYWRCQVGLASDAHDWVSMHRYLGTEKPDPVDGGMTDTGSSDLVFRNQFRAWRHYMLGDPMP